MMTEAVPKNIRLPYQALTLEQREAGFDILKSIDRKELVGDNLLLLEDADFNYCI
jgi:4-hydroxy-tetrahydrodipicolinate synthase